jgi:Ras-related protein Rab-8A
VFCEQDTAGREKVAPLTRSYYRAANVVLIVFDLTNRKTFDSVRRWFAEAEKNASSGYGPIACLISTRSDLTDKREVSDYEARELARELNIRYFETSAKQIASVEKPLLSVSSMALKKIIQRTREHAALAKPGGAATRPPPNPPEPVSQSWFSDVFASISNLFK